jgi:hypothetical protein
MWIDVFKTARSIINVQAKSGDNSKALGEFDPNRKGVP